MYVVDWLHKQALRHPDKPALVDSVSGRARSFREVDERASRFAELVRDRWRLAPGARVAVLAGNSTDYLEMLYGCAKAGVVMACLNWRLPAAELAPIVEDAQPGAFVCGEEYTAVAGAVLAGRAPLPGLVVRGVAGAAGAESGAPSLAPGSAAAAAMAVREGGAHAPGGGPDGAWPDYESALAASSGRVVEMPCPTMEAPWYLLYTSGTTGRPKGVIQTYGMAFFNAVHAMLATRLSGDDVLLAALPFFHTGGLNLYANPILFAGGTVVVMRQFDAGEALRWLCTGITQFVGVPTQYLLIAQHPGFAASRFAKMRHWSAGGSPMPRALLETWAAKGVTICFGFGMTETGPTVFLPDEAAARAKPGSVGKPVGTMLTRVVDAQGRDCAAHQRGELLVKGPGVTPGYWNNAEATRAALRDGWLHTGDVAYFDDDGDYWIVDRLKDMFISGGENVYPAEIENLLYQMPQVAEAAVIGVRDAKWGEVGLAAIVLRSGAVLDAVQVRAFCRERLAGYKVPRHVRFVAALPRTPAGKVEKPSLRQRFDSALPGEDS
ncbi:MAG: AMP-binding protein [Burkholderiales bacterium]|nr:AMP-binding protein [Burkholderiales bacterium]OJX06976.1 MAG: long-chain fatty acid--CoA ligase [Burkholderiales bacterium 70-64]